jgi:hypothetical protein
MCLHGEWVNPSFIKKWLARVAMNKHMDEHCSRQLGANKMGWPYGYLTQIGLAWKVNCFFKLWWSIPNQGKGSSNCQDNHFLPRKVIVKHWMFHCVTTFYSKSKLYQVFFLKNHNLGIVKTFFLRKIVFELLCAARQKIFWNIIEFFVSKWNIQN